MLQALYSQFLQYKKICPEYLLKTSILKVQFKPNLLNNQKI